jgi:16S rRNA (guanine527-N7)-methyltransferase
MISYIQFWTLAATNGIVLDTQQREALQRYHKEMLYWNRKINLISRKDEEFFLEKHICHALSILKYVDIPTKSKCMDIGTGGGIPGIPVAIAGNNLDMTLVDSINKKVKTTDMLAKHTGLRKIRAVCSRIEDLEQDAQYYKQMDYIMARGLARLERIVTWSKNLLKPNGKYLLLKGGDLADEIDEAKNEHKNLKVEEIQIDFFGYDYFKNEEKKLLICTLN